MFFEIDIRLQRCADLDLAIKYFNGMAVKRFYEATLKNQFAMKVEQKNEGFLQNSQYFYIN